MGAPQAVQLVGLGYEGTFAPHDGQIFAVMNPVSVVGVAPLMPGHRTPFPPSAQPVFQ